MRFRPSLSSFFYILLKLDPSRKQCLYVLWFNISLQFFSHVGTEKIEPLSRALDPKSTALTTRPSCSSKNIFCFFSDLMSQSTIFQSCLGIFTASCIFNQGALMSCSRTQNDTIGIPTQDHLCLVLKFYFLSSGRRLHLK